MTAPRIERHVGRLDWSMLPGEAAVATFTTSDGAPWPVGVWSVTAVGVDAVATVVVAGDTLSASWAAEVTAELLAAPARPWRLRQDGEQRAGGVIVQTRPGVSPGPLEQIAVMAGPVPVEVTVVASTSGGDGVTVHGDLDGREEPDQHPIESISGLEEALDGKAPTVHGHDRITGGGSSVVTGYDATVTTAGDLTGTIGDGLSLTAGQQVHLAAGHDLTGTGERVILTGQYQADLDSEGTARVQGGTEVTVYSSGEVNIGAGGRLSISIAGNPGDAAEVLTRDPDDGSSVVWAPINADPAGAAAEALSDARELIDALDADAVGADPAGTASTAVAAHVAATDPHGDRAAAEALIGARGRVVNTDGEGNTLYVGSVAPSSPVAGDVWLDTAP